MVVLRPVLPLPIQPFSSTDMGETMLARQVVRRAEPMAAAADDERIVAGLRLGVAPLRLPAALPGEAAPQQRQAGKPLHRPILQIRWYA